MAAGFFAQELEASGESPERKGKIFERNRVFFLLLLGFLSSGSDLSTVIEGV